MADIDVDYLVMSPKELARQIKALETQMFEHARNLEFEQAAQVRDETHTLNQHLLGLKE